MKNISRREFVHLGTQAGIGSLLYPYLGQVKPKKSAGQRVVGHGNFRYKVNDSWGNLNPLKTPVKNCHEMVMDRQNRLIMITDEIRNNIIMYDRSGKLLTTWGDQFPGGHGLTLFSEGSSDTLIICDYKLGKVVKTSLEGKILQTFPHPAELGIYTQDQPYKPTESAVTSNGDVYVTDGYGSQFVIQYDWNGKYIRHFGGKGDTDSTFDTCHGICVDHRGPGAPTLLITSRNHNAFKRFSLDGTYIETIFLPGAFVCRPVIDEDNLYAGVCWSRLKYLNRTPDSGFVTILDKNNKVISNPGGTKPKYVNGRLQLMVQDQPVFQHCHDVCIDGDKNIYVCQWNAGGTYPVMLERM